MTITLLKAALIDSVFPLSESEAGVVATLGVDGVVELEKEVDAENVVEIEVVGDGGTGREILGVFGREATSRGTGVSGLSGMNDAGLGNTSIERLQ
jgi:hypothetical protein